MSKYLIFILILLVFLLSGAIFLLFQTGFFGVKASITPTAFSPENSYIFATPLRAQANGVERVRVTVFVLSSQGLGVVGRKVDLGENANLLIEAVNDTTDNYGKALFDVSTRMSGEYPINVRVDGTVLPQHIQISFN
jgi:hypothetical protein